MGDYLLSNIARQIQGGKRTCSLPRRPRSTRARTSCLRTAGQRRTNIAAYIVDVRRAAVAGVSGRAEARVCIDAVHARAAIIAGREIAHL